MQFAELSLQENPYTRVLWGFPGFSGIAPGKNEVGQSKKRQKW